MLSAQISTYYFKFYGNMFFALNSLDYGFRYQMKHDPLEYSNGSLKDSTETLANSEPLNI